MSTSPERAAAAIPVQILVVDDAPENRMALRAILSPGEYRIVEAGSGAEALLRLLEQDFAALLIDVVMPDMNGFELAAAIRERERTAAVPILFVTGQATDVDLVYSGYRVGAVDYLIKPLVPAMVRAKVAVFTQLYAEKKRNEEQAARLLEAERNENELRLIALELASERRYRTLAQSVPHIVWTAHADGAVDYFNHRWFEYTGRSVQQAGGSWLEILHADDVERCRSEWAKAVLSGEMFQTECRLRRAADGAFRWHLCRAVPEQSPTGKILSWVGTFTDIEDQKRAEAVQAEFKGTLDAEPDAVIIFEPKNWRILYVNHGATVLLGYSKDELLQMAPADVMVEHDDVTLRDMVGPLLDGSQPHLLLETQFRRKALMDPVEVSMQLIRIGADRIVSIARDITERKRTQLERELLYREAVDAIRARDEFLSVASHELRTPLSTLQLQIQMLLQPPRRSSQVPLSREQMKPKLELAFKQIARLTRLIEELMDISRITAGRLRLEPEDVDLAGVVREVVVRLGEEATRTHSSIEINAPTPVVGRWDVIRVEQVVTNLLMNAFKFGGGKPIEITVEERGTIGRMVVADHGIGIAPEDASGFSTVTSRPRHRARPADWGLASTSLARSSRRTAGPFGSRASAGSARRSRSIFRGEPSAAKTEPRTRLGRYMPKRILIVEDDQDVAQSVAEVLEASGYCTAIAGNGREALDHLQHNDLPDLILLDMMTPVMDGWQFREEQRTVPAFAAVPVVIVTADGDARGKAAAIQAAGHVGKPATIDSLLEAVDRICGVPAS